MIYSFKGLPMSRGNIPPASGRDNHRLMCDGSGEDGRLPISRRDLIKGTLGGGVVAANAYLFTNMSQQVAAERDSGVRSRFQNQIALNVNGRRRHATIEDQERLLETLRYRLGLTGGKFGCDRAMCGACTVNIDGEPVYGCTYLTRDAVGKEISTVEGLSENGQLHPIQDAFLEELGGQCAFCTPGFIMSAKALLEDNPSPNRDEVKQGLAGNLCRCGNYENEIKSVLRAAERM